jgi:nucleoside-diphosphate-sugar epimerase
VGSTLCDELTRQGHDVAILIRKTSSTAHLQHAKVRPVEGDLRVAESLGMAVKGAEVIFHVAGVVAARNREEYFASNAIGTKNLALAAQGSQDLRRFIYVSSLAAGGPAEGGAERVETDAPKPVSFYGESKLAGEEILKELGIPSIVIRPPAVYGPRDRGILTFFQMIHRGILPVLGTDKNNPRRYSFVHVDDLVRGILAAAFTKEELGSQEIFYITGDGTYTWEEAMALIAKGMNKKTFTLPLPIPLLRGAAAACSAISKVSGKVLPLSLDKMKELEAMAWTCSSKKAKAKLGFTPYWEFARGAQQTAHWYQEHGWL